MLFQNSQLGTLFHSRGFDASLSGLAGFQSLDGAGLPPEHRQDEGAPAELRLPAVPTLAA